MSVWPCHSGVETALYTPPPRWLATSSTYCMALLHSSPFQRSTVLLTLLHLSISCHGSRTADGSLVMVTAVLLPVVHSGLPQLPCAPLRLQPAGNRGLQSAWVHLCKLSWEVKIAFQRNFAVVFRANRASSKATRLFLTK